MSNYRIVYPDADGDKISVDSDADTYEEVYGEAYTLTDKGYFVIYQTILAPETVSGSYEIRVGDLYTDPDYSLDRSHNS